MAYTITSLGTEATIVGTSATDLLTSIADYSVATINSFEGADYVTIDGDSSNSYTFSATIGMGGGADEVTIDSDDETVDGVTITLGDSTDTFTWSDNSTQFDITVGGQGGADTFNLGNNAADDENFAYIFGNSRFAGGQGQDSFFGYFTIYDGGNTVIVGGSENDSFGTADEDFTAYVGTNSSLFINGQVGEDSFDLYLTTYSGGEITVRGGSEDDTFTISAGGDDIFVYGDNGNDEIIFDDGSNYANSIFGGADNDTLNGSDGDDTLTGGSGNDRYEVASGDGSNTSDTTTFLTAASNGTVIEFGSEFKTIDGFETGDTFATDLETSIAVGNGELAFAADTQYVFYGTITTGNAFVVQSGGPDAFVYLGNAAADATAFNTVGDEFVLISDAAGFDTSSFVAI